MASITVPATARTRESRDFELDTGLRLSVFGAGEPLDVDASRAAMIDSPATPPDVSIELDCSGDVTVEAAGEVAAEVAATERGVLRAADVVGVAVAVEVTLTIWVCTTVTVEVGLGAGVVEVVGSMVDGVELALVVAGVVTSVAGEVVESVDVSDVVPSRATARLGPVPRVRAVRTANAAATAQMTANRRASRIGARRWLDTVGSPFPIEVQIIDWSTFIVCSANSSIRRDFRQVFRRGTRTLPFASNIVSKRTSTSMYRLKCAI